MLALTALHHLYGAIIYATPWRYHVTIVAVPLLAVLALAYGLHRRRPGSALGRASLRVFVGTTLAVPVVAIGLFEGGYNHAFKILLHAGASPETFARWFPPPRYEPPTDLWFEASGVLQLALALLAARLLLRLRRERRTRAAATGGRHEGSPESPRRRGRPAIRPTPGGSS